MRKRFGIRKKDGERGQSLVEFALVAPVFLLILFAIVDFGMGFHSWISVTNSAREGARVGAVGAVSDTTTTTCSPSLPLDGSIERRVCDTVGTAICTPSMDVTVGQPPAAESVVVQVDCAYNLITPLAGIIQMVTGNLINWSTLNLSSTATMRLEQ
jgi:Flp pilus assembly protein TadG